MHFFAIFALFGQFPQIHHLRAKSGLYVSAGCSQSHCFAYNWPIRGFGPDFLAHDLANSSKMPRKPPPPKKIRNHQKGRRTRKIPLLMVLNTENPQENYKILFMTQKNFLSKGLKAENGSKKSGRYSLNLMKIIFLSL